MEWFRTFSFYSLLFFELNLLLESKSGFSSADEFHWQTGQFGRSCLAIGKCRKFSQTFLWLLSLVTKTVIIITKKHYIACWARRRGEILRGKYGREIKMVQEPFNFFVFVFVFLPFPLLTIPTAEASMFWVEKRHWKKLQNNFCIFALISNKVFISCHNFIVKMKSVEQYFYNSWSDLYPFLDER